MVRLRREVEGVRRNHAVAAAPWAGDGLWSHAVLPAWTKAVGEATPKGQEWPLRVGLAGALPVADVAAVLERGHLVTWVEPDAARRDALLSLLAPEQTGRLTIVAKDYGEAALAASAFDVVVLQDALPCYHEPRWVLHKLARELKPGCKALIRLTARPATALPVEAASIAALGHDAAPGAGRALLHKLIGRHKFISKTLAADPLDRAPATVRPLAEAALWRFAAREAHQRGAHRVGHPEAPALADVWTATAEVLHPTHVWIGHPERLTAADLQWQARTALQTALRALLPYLPELGPLPSDQPCVVALQVERRLAGWQQAMR